MKRIFTERVLQTVREIPQGTVLSYAEVARLAGSPHAARAVGTIMRKNHDASVPCHRVVCASGKVGNYNRQGGSALKRRLLLKEGVRLIV